MNFPQDHPLHGGFDRPRRLDETDPVLVAESDAPWFPRIKGPRPEALVSLAVDPLFSRYPVRGFEADLALGGHPRLTLAALADAVRARRSRPGPRTGGALDHRVIAEREARAHRPGQRRAADAPSTWRWVSRCVGEVVDDHTIVVNEYDLDANQVPLPRPGSYFASPPLGGLGWGLGAALGAKLAAPDTRVICCVGDGSYIFGAPTAVHLVVARLHLPVLSWSSTTAPGTR